MSFLMETDICMWLIMEIIEFSFFHLVSVESHPLFLHYLFFHLGSTSSTSATNVAGFTWTSGSGYSELYYPTAIYVDLNGTMYILDAYNYRVVKWLPGQPLGFSVAGNHGSGSTADKIGLSYGLYLDNQGNIYISEYSNHRVSMWYNGNTTAGIVVSTVVLSEINGTCYRLIIVFLRWPVSVVVLEAHQINFIILGVYM